MTEEHDDPVVQVRRRGEDEATPRCHYCGGTSDDLATEVIGDGAWRVERRRHPEGECPPIATGWAACYRCDRALAADEQRAVTLRMDTALGRMREERILTTKTQVERWEPFDSPRGSNTRHSHEFDGATPSPWVEGQWIGWVRGQSESIEEAPSYQGPPVEGCLGCGITRTQTREDSASEWEAFVAVLGDATEVPYVDAYPAEDRVRCDRDGCAHASDEHARGEPTQEDIDREAAKEARREAAMARVPGHEPWRDFLPATIAEFMQRTGRSDKWCRDTLRDAAAAGTVVVSERRDRRGGSATKVYASASTETPE